MAIFTLEINNLLNIFFAYYLKLGGKCMQK